MSTIVSRIASGIESESADAYLSSLDDAGLDKLHRDYIEHLFGSDLTSRLQSGYTDGSNGSWLRQDWTAFVAKRTEAAQ